MYENRWRGFGKMPESSGRLRDDRLTGAGEREIPALEQPVFDIGVMSGRGVLAAPANAPGVKFESHKLAVRVETKNGDSAIEAAEIQIARWQR